MSLAYDPRKVCPRCPKGSKPRLLMDTSSGDLVCTACGEVLASQCFDDGQEWRSFAPEGGEAPTAGRERADKFSGGVNVLTEQIASTTMAGGSDMMRKLMMEVERSALKPKDAQLVSYDKRIRQIVNHVQLNESVLGSCQDILKQLSENKDLPKLQSAWCGAIVYVACREVGSTRTAKELARAMSQMANKTEASLEKNIATCVSKLNRMLGAFLHRSDSFAIPVEERLPRLVAGCELSAQLLQPIAHIANKVKQYQLDLSSKHNNQIALIAVSIYIAAWLSDAEKKPSLEKLCSVTGAPKTVVPKVFAEIVDFGIHNFMPEEKDFVVRLNGGVSALPVPGKR